MNSIFRMTNRHLLEAEPQSRHIRKGVSILKDFIQQYVQQPLSRTVYRQACNAIRQASVKTFMNSLPKNGDIAVKPPSITDEDRGSPA